MLDKTIMSESKQEDLLAEIRTDFTYHKDYWRDNYELASIDMQYMACDGWSSEDKASRANRPMVWPDELSQYVKQHNNSVRQNAGAMKVTPKGSGATDQDAQHRAGYIRGIEHASSAQAIYDSAGESAAMCAFGFFRVKLKKTLQHSSGKWYQEPRLARIPNWYTSYPDPDAREADFSDSRRWFVLDSMRQKAFGRRFSTATRKSFTKNDIDLAADWFSGDNMVVAEAWRAEGDEWPYKVTQYIVDGVEILKKNDWIGGWIPIIGVFGEELYVPKGGETKRIFMSLIRRALGGQKSLAFAASQELEEFGLSPRAPLQGWEGTFDARKHKNLHKVPTAFVEFQIPKNWNAQWGPPPLPTRPQFTPQIQAYEAAIERWRRSIQSAVGGNPMPTDVQKINDKSGVALDKIKQGGDVGSFHLTDNLNRAKTNAGRQINELITKLAASDSLPPEVAVIKKDQTHAIVKAISSGQLTEGEGGDDYMVADRGEFDVSLSVGASYESQRDQQDEFLDSLVQNISGFDFIAPQQKAQIVGIAMKLKPALGVVGEEIAKILNPPQDPNKQIPPEAQQAIQQAQGQVAELSAVLQKLLLERQGKVIEQQGKLQIAQIQAGVDKLSAILKTLGPMAVAEIMTKAQSADTRAEIDSDLKLELHNAAHEIALQKDQQAHEADQAEAARQAMAAEPPNQAPPDQSSVIPPQQ